MKRRGFLGRLAAAPLAVLVPTTVTPEPVPAPPEPLQSCVLFDYDGQLVLEGNFRPAGRRLVIPLRPKRIADGEPDSRFTTAVFVKSGESEYGARWYFQQTEGPQMPRRRYRL